MPRAITGSHVGRQPEPKSPSADVSCHRCGRTGLNRNRKRINGLIICSDCTGDRQYIHLAGTK